MCLSFNKTIRRLGGAMFRFFKFWIEFDFLLAYKLMENEIQMLLATNKAELRYVYVRLHKIVEDYLTKNHYYYILPSTDVDYYDPKTAPIWILWWQGIEVMPSVCRLCVMSIKKNANTHPVILISKENFKDYVDIDPIVLNKIENNKFLFAHVADLIRLRLLSVYGGLWLDSTVLLTSAIDEAAFEAPFFSIKTKNEDNISVSEYRWCSFVLGGKAGSWVFNSLANMMENYMKRNDVFVHYLLIDYFIDLLYRQENSFTLLLDNVPYTHPALHQLRYYFDKPFDKCLWDDFMKDTSIFKLTYKGSNIGWTTSKTRTFRCYIQECIKE